MDVFLFRFGCDINFRSKFRRAIFVGRMDDERVQELLSQSIAPSTRVKYTARRRRWRWETYCRELDVAHLPADPTVSDRFLTKLTFDGITKTNNAAVAAAVAWRHSIDGFTSPRMVVFVGKLYQQKASAEYSHGRSAPRYAGLLFSQRGSMLH